MHFPLCSPRLGSPYLLPLAVRVTGYQMAVRRGDGLGSLLVVSYSNSQFSTLWSGSVVIVAVSVFLYTLVSGLEGPVLKRFSVQASPN